MRIELKNTLYNFLFPRLSVVLYHMDLDSKAWA